MKKYIMCAVLLCFASNYLLSQSQKSVINSFEHIVKQVDILFSSSPVVLITKEYGNLSATGEINFLLKFIKMKIYHNIKIDDSLISPFSAYILLRVLVQSNADAGNIKNPDGKTCWGFETADEALQVRTFHSCSEENDVDCCIGDIKIVYAFRNGHWIFNYTEDTSDESRLQDEVTRRQLHRQISENPNWVKYINPNK